MINNSLRGLYANILFWSIKMQLLKVIETIFLLIVENMRIVMMLTAHFGSVQLRILASYARPRGMWLVQLHVTRSDVLRYER